MYPLSKFRRISELCWLYINLGKRFNPKQLTLFLCSNIWRRFWPGPDLLNICQGKQRAVFLNCPFWNEKLIDVVRLVIILAKSENASYKFPVSTLSSILFKKPKEIWFLIIRKRKDAASHLGVVGIRKCLAFLSDECDSRVQGADLFSTQT